MTFRPTSHAGGLFLLSSLALSACSSASSPGTPDASQDAPSVTPGDAGDAREGKQDAKTPVDASHDSADAHVTIDGTKPHADGAVPKDATDAQDAAPEGASPEASPDAPAEAGFDAGPPALRYIGRTLTDGTSPDGNGSCTTATPCFEWSGTQIVARFTGATAISFTMSDYGNYFDVYVDGVLQSTPIVGVTGQSSYPVATGLDKTMTHEVRLYKRTEASTTARTMISGVTFPNGGALLPPAPAATRRIEVVGDSISCGYGVLGPNATCTETPSLEDHDDSYGALTARSLSADLYTIASSGRGMYENVDGTTTGTLPDIYGLTLPYVSNGSPSSWSFATWTPDAVIIDLGTNDYAGAGGDPGQPFVTAYLAFVKRVRLNYPDAYIVCANGPMLSGAEYTQAQTYIQSVVSMMADPKVVYLAFPTQVASNGEGCDGHPSVTTHQLMATQLTAALKSALNW